MEWSATYSSRARGLWRRSPRRCRRLPRARRPPAGIWLETTSRSCPRTTRQPRRGVFEDLLSNGLTRHTLKGWGLQAVAFADVFATLAYFGTLAASPWLGFHLHPLFIALTGVFAIERAITVRSRGWKAAFASMTVFGEWFYDLYLQAVQLRALWGPVWQTSKAW
jgi:hypothetical protein